MRLSTDADRDEELAGATIAAAVQAGITVFDTAHAYGHGEAEVGHNERLVARALSLAGDQSDPRTGSQARTGSRAHTASRARIITKGGMTRPGGAWVPDGRAKSILTDCEASLTALDGLPIDLYLIHAPDPRTPWRTSVRALGRLLDEGLAARVGLSNVTRGQLDEAIALAPIAAVQLALSVHDDRALRGGVVERCEELGIAVIAHSPLGGPGRAGRLDRRSDLADAAAAGSATPAEVALAWLLDLSPAVVAIPGARRPETARSAARAARLSLPAAARNALSRSDLERRRAGTAPVPRDDAEIVLIMGIPGAGKTRVATEYVGRGYLRLNRDERGGALRELAAELERRLEEGDSRVVLDNTYLSRAARSYVLDAARRHAIPVRCVWLETSLAQAQVNLVQRLLERCGELPTPEALRELARRDPGLLAPTQQMRALRELEPPSADEGFATVEVLRFERSVPDDARGGVFVAAAALEESGWERALRAGDPRAPHLVFDWRPDGTPGELEAAAALLRGAHPGSAVEVAVCAHGGGPPRCWCRPPLPGLPLAFARAHGLDPARSILFGTSPAHRTLAAALGARYVSPDAEPWR